MGLIGFSSFAGPGVPAAIYIGDNANPVSLTFIDVKANAATGSYNIASGQLPTAWRMPAHAVAAQFINSNNPPVIFTFANLPFAMTGITGGVTGKVLL